jgi:hypothetical protein
VANNGCNPVALAAEAFLKTQRLQCTATRDQYHVFIINLPTPNSNLAIVVFIRMLFCWRISAVHLLASLAIGDTHRDASLALLAYGLRLFAEMAQYANVSELLAACRDHGLVSASVTLWVTYRDLVTPR